MTAPDPKTVSGALAVALDALERIESGRPACGVESSLATDGSWREYVRQLQGIARLALHKIKAGTT